MRSVEVSAQNISNISTPGYKRRVSFEQLVRAPDTQNSSPTTPAIGADFSAGKLVETGNPYDLALGGEGFFAVRSGEQVLYTRQGQFQRAADGRLITAQGMALQAEGGDLVLKGGRFEVLSDGAVLEDGLPVARLALFDIADRTRLGMVGGSLFTAGDEDMLKAPGASVRQGAIEASNVSTADEMVAVMAAMRRAESAQRLVGVYDDLMGRALTTFGQA